MTALVSPDNFVRAESDRYFAGIVGDGGFGRFPHRRRMGSGSTFLGHQHDRADGLAALQVGVG
ncbi:hypothetical protein E0T84_02690 [Mycobacterium sp. DBP42]|nr:hypothetical protein E0T84_02690 [Mycobacterium sp. DBP42]